MKTRITVFWGFQTASFRRENEHMDLSERLCFFPGRAFRGGTQVPIAILQYSQILQQCTTTGPCTWVQTKDQVNIVDPDCRWDVGLVFVLAHNLSR